jgi:hypothetical protein
MKKRMNYYNDLAADYSRPGLVAESLQSELIALSLKIDEMKKESPPVVGDDYPMSQVEQETSSGGRRIARHCGRVEGTS